MARSEVFEAGSREAEDGREAAEIEAWVEAGAPSPADMWRALQLAGSDPRPAAAELPQWLTTEDVAAMVSKSPRTIRKAIREGRLTASGGPPQPYRVARDDAVAFASASTAPRRRVPAPPKRGRRAAGTTFRDLARKAKP